MYDADATQIFVLVFILEMNFTLNRAHTLALRCGDLMVIPMHRHTHTHSREFELVQP